MPFFATMPITMISPMKDETLNVVRVISSARNTPEVERTADERIASGAENVRNSKSSTRKISTSASNRHHDEIVKRLLLLLISAAILHADRRAASFRSFTAFCTARSRAQIDAFQACRHFHIALQIVAKNLRLPRQFRHRGHGAESGRLPLEFTSIVLLIASSEARFASGKRTRNV